VLDPRLRRRDTPDPTHPRYNPPVQTKEQLMQRVNVLVRIGVVTAAAACALAVRAQDIPMPKPGPEHDVFKEDAGTWDAVVEVTPAPGMQPIVSKGVETNVVGCSGLCLISDFTSEVMPGTPFHGHGITVWDPAKKKYVGSWTDSMSTGLAIGETTYDRSARKATGWMEGPDASGKPIKARVVMEYTASGTRVMTSHTAGPDGKEFLSLKISYTRRK
jgi:hypothetical protein